MPRLALLRHGHTAWNREGRLQGRTDIPLDEEAITGLSELRLPRQWDGVASTSSYYENLTAIILYYFMKPKDS